jgi:hypothetical protein
MPRKFNREPEEAKRLNVCTRTLREWRFRRIIPYHKIGRVVLYDPERVDQAIARYERGVAVR